MILKYVIYMKADCCLYGSWSYSYNQIIKQHQIWILAVDSFPLNNSAHKTKFLTCLLGLAFKEEEVCNWANEMIVGDPNNPPRT